jgi:hypothetical protein
MGKGEMSAPPPGPCGHLGVSISAQLAIQLHNAVTQQADQHAVRWDTMACTDSAVDSRSRSHDHG